MNKDKLQRYQNPEDVRRRRKSFARVVLVVVILILLCLCFRSCRARDEPIIATDRVYEEDHRPSYEDVIPSEENKRLSLAFSDNYRITDENPVFYIGFPEENIFDVVLTIKNLEGTELYRTDFVAPGTNVAIDGTGFLGRGEQQVECLALSKESFSAAETLANFLADRDGQDMENFSTLDVSIQNLIPTSGTGIYYTNVPLKIAVQ